MKEKGGGTRFVCVVWVILRTEGVFALINASKGYEWCMKTRLIMKIQSLCTGFWFDVLVG
jgi:hypothetical protein